MEERGFLYIVLDWAGDMWIRGRGQKGALYDVIRFDTMMGDETK